MFKQLGCKDIGIIEFQFLANTFDTPLMYLFFYVYVNNSLK